jgi:hypothetical protein
LIHKEKILQYIKTAIDDHKIETWQKNFDKVLFKVENHSQIVKNWLKLTGDLNEDD